MEQWIATIIVSFIFCVIGLFQAHTIDKQKIKIKELESLPTMKDKKALYTCVKTQSKQLLSYFRCDMPQQYGDHMTIKYKPTEEEIAQFSSGIDDILTVYAIMRTDNFHAVLVESKLFGRYPKGSDSPFHITLGTDGIPPGLFKAIYSTKPKIDIIAHPYVIKGTTAIVYGA